MREIFGDLWDYHERGYWIAITTNGVTRNDGALVMGRGIAAQTKARYQQLPYTLGRLVSMHGNIPHVLPRWRIVSFPVKHHWQHSADPDLIIESARALALMLRVFGALYLPRPGCGNGQLRWSDVRPLIAPIFPSDNVVVVERLA